MNIWIVEDNETDALRAAKAVVAAVRSTPSMSMGSTHLYWEQTLHWEPRLCRVLVGEEPRLSDDKAISRLTPDVAPTAVVLDLLDKEGAFQAQTFLSALRTWEVEQHIPASFVIIWSVNSGRQEVKTFVDLEPLRDWRVRWLGTKGDVELTRAVQGYLRTQLELKYQ
jgi:hypothetical protein